jgi:hypothetical protein
MKIIKIIKKYFQKQKISIILRKIYSFLYKEKREFYKREILELKKITEQIGNTLKVPLYRLEDSQKTVLIMGMGDVKSIALESSVRKSFELAGYRCKILVPQDQMIIKAYKQLGCDQLIFFAHYEDDSINEASKILEKCSNLDDVINININGVRCGKYAASTLMRKTRSGSLNLADHSIRKELTVALNRSIQCAKTSSKLILVLKADALVLVDRGYSPSGELFDTFINSRIPVFTWNATHRNDSLMLKRYTNSNRDMHPSSLSNESWEKIKNNKSVNNFKQLISEELETCYNSGEWYGEVGTQLNKKTLRKDEIYKILDLNIKKRTVIIFPHIFWDATFFWGSDIFENYEEWFVETLKAACKNSEVNWIIKVHPANIVKNNREGIKSEHSEIKTIKQTIGILPKHVKIIEADAEISSLSLIKMVDACVTVRGTVGIEAACFGVPVITAGTGRYDRLGFTIDSDNRFEYIKRLNNVQNLSRLNNDQIELANKYAWGVFIARPFSLKFLRMRYLQTAMAELEIEFIAKTYESLKMQEDLILLSQWIKSDTEDYLLI